MIIINPILLIIKRQYALSCHGISMPSKLRNRQGDTFFILKMVYKRIRHYHKTLSQLICSSTIAKFYLYNQYPIICNPHRASIKGSAQLNCIRKLSNIIRS